MDGRWTLDVCKICGRNCLGGFQCSRGHGIRHVGKVPVVPCDDAALERAADEIERLMTDKTVWNVREAAERVLRAAAGTT